MEIILGLTAAVCWGTSDFCARFASRRIGAYRTLMLMQIFGGAVLTLYLWRTGAWARLAVFGPRPWVFAIVGALVNTAASLALFHAFEIGTMSVAAPVSSAYPAVTVTLSLISGERLSAVHGAGVAVIFVGVILAALSMSPTPEPAEARSSKPETAPDQTIQAAPARLVRGGGWAILSACGFGLMFWWFGFHVVREIGGAASVWVARLTSFFALLLAAMPLRRDVSLPRGNVWWLLAVVGLVDTAAFVANNVGMSLGHVSVVAVLSSLYGAVTVLLGAIFVREPLRKTQWCGIALIFAGIVLVNL
ncbi:MAG TPA: EamA family transporter [Candidatus Acidoferrales bacterium]|nr:EamA family transporter [Candidatus Acidoferrales bacterium]